MTNLARRWPHAVLFTWLWISLPGCAAQPDAPLAAPLGQLGLATAFSIESSSRFRLSGRELLRLAAVDPGADRHWLEAAHRGVLGHFPLAQVAAPRAPSAAGTGVTAYILWPSVELPASDADAVPADTTDAQPWYVALPVVLGQQVRRRLRWPRVRTIAVTCIDDQSGRILHQARLHIRTGVGAAPAEWSSVVARAFGRYARELAAG